MEKFYEFAGVQIAVIAAEEMMYTRDVTLEPFRIDAAADPYRFVFECVDQLTPPSSYPAAVTERFTVYHEGDAKVRYIGAVAQDTEKACIRASQRGREIHVQLKNSVFKGTMSANTVLNAISAEHLIARENGFVLHSSYIQVGEEGVLFTAPSGTGKSTQAELWHTLRGARILNGDRSAVRMHHGTIAACGIPYAGSSSMCENVTLPLKAIVYLSQSKHTEIRQLRGAEAFRSVWEGVSVNTWDKEDMNKVIDMVQQTVLNVPVFSLSCTPDETAVIALEQMLKK